MHSTVRLPRNTQLDGPRSIQAGERSPGEANSGADFRFQSESTCVDACGHPPVSGRHRRRRPPRLVRPHPRLGGKGRCDPPLILNAGWSSPARGPEAAAAQVVRGATSQPGHPKALSVSLLVQASKEVLMQGGKLLALVIIMLSALEEQVSGFCFFLFVFCGGFFFFGVFYLKKRSKRTVTAKL